MRKLFLSAVLVAAGVVSALATNVKITMNAVSTTMTLADKTTGNTVAVGEPANKVYSFSAAAGTYVLTAYDTDGETVNGTLELTIGDEDAELKLFTLTAYATNASWAYGTDYTINYRIVGKTGEERT